MSRPRRVLLNFNFCLSYIFPMYMSGFLIIEQVPADLAVVAIP